MKRKEEVDIILGAFKSVGLEVDDAVEKAISSGIKQVREKRYRDHHRKMERKKKENTP